jgi:predicted phage tail protein
MKNTVRKIRLEGELGEKFGEVWNLNVQTPHEAIRAIECQTKGFRKHILDNAEKGIGYEVIIGDQGIKQEEELLYPSPMRDAFTIVPTVQGSKSRGFGMIMMGAAIFLTAGAAAGMFAPAFTMTGQVAGSLGTMQSAGVMGLAALETASSLQLAGMYLGASLMMSGASMLLAPTIEGSAGNEEQSYLFDGAVNSVKQGTPVPILYGRMMVGGSVISASIKSNQETAGIRGNGRRYVTGVGGSSGWPGYNPGNYPGQAAAGKGGKR